MSTDKKPVTHRFQPLPTGKKVFDVVRPGKSPAPANSRSVIMSSPPDVTDGQFVVPGAPALPGKPTTTAKHPLTTSKEKPKEAPQQDNEPPKPAAQPIEPEPGTEPEVPTQEPVSPEEQERRSSKAPSVVMLSAIDAALDAESEVETPAAEQGQKPKEAPEEPGPQRRVSIHIEQDTEMAPETIDISGDGTTDEGERPETEAEDGPRQPAAVAKTAKTQIAVFTETEVSQSLVKPLTEDEIAAHLSHEDLLANTAAPDVDRHDMVVSHHHHRMKVWQFILILLLIVTVALAALNFLLDAEIIKTELDIPHTNFISS